MKREITGAKTNDNCCADNPAPVERGLRSSQMKAHQQSQKQNMPAKLAEPSVLGTHWDLLLALLTLTVLLVIEYGFDIVLGNPWRLIISVAAYLLAGWNVLRMAWRKLSRGDVFNEFVLMSVATIGAFCIGEYYEGVGVMVFYSIGEWFQELSVKRAKSSIKALLDVRPNEVTVLHDGKPTVVDPANVDLGEHILIKPGEKVALDGELLSENASFNTAALTGESIPNTKYKGEPVLAGMINLNTLATVKVNASFTDSKLSNILEMVQDATARKSQTQLFISRFAKVYTPIVFFLALTVVVIPYFVTDNYVFTDWLYRGLIFLVISCPCALVVSIPLGYFGGIGLASRNGILFKGGNFLDVMTKVNTVVMDKTGTLTKAVFKVQQVEANNFDKKELVRLAAALERNSSHPIGRAIVEFESSYDAAADVSDVEEIAGHGLRGLVNGREVLVGNQKLLVQFNISYPAEIQTFIDTTVLVAVDNRFAGFFVISDELKPDSKTTVSQLRAMSIRVVMLSGDHETVVQKVARELGVDDAYGNLLPADKVEQLKKLKAQGNRIAFVGDGINDAPVVAIADVGIAMGGLGSDATIETADVVIQNDQPSKIVSAIRIGKITRNIVWQNIVFAMTVKIIVLTLGAEGIANLWEAVIADVGVALLAILNAVRIQGMRV